MRKSYKRLRGKRRSNSSTTSNLKVPFRAFTRRHLSTLSVVFLVLILFSLVFLTLINNRPLSKLLNSKSLPKSGSTPSNSLHQSWQKLLHTGRELSHDFINSVKSIINSQEAKVINQNGLPFLIDTPTCRLRDWPLFDPEIKFLFQNNTNKDFGCDKNQPLLNIKRVNFTWILIQFPVRPNLSDSNGWECLAQELRRTSHNDRFDYGPSVGPLTVWNNFAHNLTEAQLSNESYARWDSVKVSCKKYPDEKVKYSIVIPLVQNYKPRISNITSKNKVNILLLGLDSISRLNFLRHMNQTRHFLESKQFIPLVGYHKVGENSYPNIVPMLTGHFSDHFYNETNPPKKFNFDHVPFLWKHFQQAGYVTTFVEDMPIYGFFSRRGGFHRQPTDYYLRPMNLAINWELYYTSTCYQKWLEHEIYWDFMLDQLKAFRERDHNVPFFTFSHLSTLTHNYFNHPGYADMYYLRFIKRLFADEYHKNTLIILYSDHGLRFGDSLNTAASVYEQRLPFIYVYLPDSLRVDGKTAEELRAILRVNTNRLTSHFDLHPTLLHVLYGVPPSDDNDEPHGRSLLRPISTNRTCTEAGILPQYCLCQAYHSVAVSESVTYTSAQVLHGINQMFTQHGTTGNYCVPLTLHQTYRAFDSDHSTTISQRHRIVHFRTMPNDAVIEGIVTLSGNGSIGEIVNLSRLNRYGSQARCVEQLGFWDIVPFCYCWSEYNKHH